MDKSFNLKRLDVKAFAQAGEDATGTTPLADFPRLAEESVRPAPAQPVHWRLHGELRHTAAGDAQPWLLAEASTRLPLQCQRCLEPVDTPIETHQWFRFVATEEQAEQEDELADEDVLALDGPLNMQQVIEDDMLLALPEVPLHDNCQPPAALQQETEGFAEAGSTRRNPFAQLAGLRGGPARGGENAD
ncbi:YceD family protein [Corticibacter populi]|nr:DUF177 domain-containing protein [Corticibacter populi]RZS33409.1 uncharacterized protein EV687_1733 [Corticibacter populi]